MMLCLHTVVWQELKHWYYHYLHVIFYTVSIHVDYSYLHISLAPRAWDTLTVYTIDMWLYWMALLKIVPSIVASLV